MCSCAICSLEPNDGKVGGVGELEKRSLRSSRKGVGDVGGVPNSSIGSSLGDLGGEGDLDG